jgi:hypothetical protein
VLPKAMLSVMVASIVQWGDSEERKDVPQEMAGGLEHVWRKTRPS